MVNKKILVIGAGSQSKHNPSIKGIGTCLIERLSREKQLSILFTYCNSEKGASQLVKRVTLSNPSCEISCLRFNSLRYEKDWSVLDSKLSQFGTPYIFVYNAGVRFYKEELSKDERKETMKVNYHCPIFLIKKIANKMAAAYGRGKIIITSSILAGKHHPFLEEYCSSKGLLKRYVQEHEDYWKNKGIEILVVYPNVTRTPMTEERLDFYRGLVKEGKLQKISSSEEIAESIAKLCFNSL